MENRTWLRPFGRIELLTAFTKRRLETMSDEKMIHLNEGAIKSELKEQLDNLQKFENRSRQCAKMGRRS